MKKKYFSLFYCFFIHLIASLLYSLSVTEFAAEAAAGAADDGGGHQEGDGGGPGPAAPDDHGSPAPCRDPRGGGAKTKPVQPRKWYFIISIIVIVIIFRGCCTNNNLYSVRFCCLAFPGGVLGAG